MKEDILPLLNKYDVPVPRYTSYPTVPYWEAESIDAEKWKQAVVNTFRQENGELSIYIHLPFCENLCTFCACNKRITKNHKVEDPYLQAVLKEWAMYRSMLPSEPIIKEIHLGGGTPTFFSPEHLVELAKGITKDAQIAPEHEFSIEVHPNFTTEAHLEALASVGFNRISLGVQDFDPVVQFIINRVQSFEKTKEVVEGLICSQTLIRRKAAMMPSFSVHLAEETTCTMYALRYSSARKMIITESMSQLKTEKRLSELAWQEILVRDDTA